MHFIIANYACGKFVVCILCKCNKCILFLVKYHYFDIWHKKILHVTLIKIA